MYMTQTVEIRFSHTPRIFDAGAEIPGHPEGYGIAGQTAPSGFMKRKSKWIWGIICIIVAAASIAVVSFRQSILTSMGKFMAPEAEEIDSVADLAILEGTAFVSTGMVSRGIQLLSSGKAKRLVIVLHSVSQNYWPFACDEDYASAVRTKLKSIGLDDSEFRVIVTHIHEPITLVAARGALEDISRDGIRSAILVSPGFHMRRSYLVYQHLAAPLKIKIYPVACFDSYELNNWWTHEYGARDFFSEGLKLLFYIIRGYIPAASLVRA